MGRKLCVLFLLSIHGIGHAEPIGLLTAYEKALQYDAQYRAAQAGNRAQNEEVGMAMAGLLPKVGMTLTNGRNSTDRTPVLTKNGGHSTYETKNYSLNIRQPIFNMANLAIYRQAKAVSAQSDAMLTKERFELLPRVAGSYLNILYAIDNIEHSRTFKGATLKQLAGAEMKFKMGQGTITEISEARAEYEKALSEELTWANALELNRYTLEAMIGEYPKDVMGLDPQKIIKEPLALSSLDEWIQIAIQNNPEIVAARQSILAAEQELEKMQAGHYPTVDLVASRTKSESDTNYSIGNGYDTTSLSLQLNIPIYSGGYVNASVRQAVAKLQEGNERLDLQIRSVTTDVRKYFNLIMNGKAQQNAYEQAEKSDQVALLGTQKAYEYGTRTNVDVLNAQEKLFKSRVDLSQSRYTYVNDLISFYNVVGMANQDQIVRLNAWFIVH